MVPGQLECETADVGEPDVAIIKVLNRSSPANVAGAIAGAVYAGKRIFVRAIGANAVNQAVKACIVANGYVWKSRRQSLFLAPSFDKTPNENDPLKDWTVVVLEVHATAGAPPEL